MKVFKIRFFENRKWYFMISGAVILIGIIFNLIFGVQLDIQFTGGAVIRYSFSGDVSQDNIESVVEAVTDNTSASVIINEDVRTEAVSYTHLDVYKRQILY